MSSEELLTLRQAAARVGLTDSALRHAIRRGRLPAVKLGRDWLVRPSDLDAYRRRALTRCSPDGGPPRSR